MIQGLAILPCFIDDEEEPFLTAQLDDGGFSWERSEGQRPSAQFGSRYDYVQRKLDDAAPVPAWLMPFCHRLCKTTFGAVPEQVIVNQYTASDGIAAHIDHQVLFGPAVASLSLLSSTVLTFRKAHKNGYEVPVVLQPRTLLLLEGEARYEWYHEIKPETLITAADLQVEKRKRYSITFRTVLASPASGERQ